MSELKPHKIGSPDSRSIGYKRTLDELESSLNDARVTRNKALGEMNYQSGRTAGLQEAIQTVEEIYKGDPDA